VRDGLAIVNGRILLKEDLVMSRCTRRRPATPFPDGKDSHDDAKAANNSKDAGSRSDGAFVVEKARAGSTGAGGGSNNDGTTDGRTGT